MTRSFRKKALEDLIHLRRPIAESVEELRKHPWDSDRAIATLTRQDVIELLEAFLSGRLTASEVELWANALEGRDDLGLEDEYDTLLQDFLFEASTPEITRPLTEKMVDEWRFRLR